MKILVVNCNHWIGYHIVEELLDQDYSVDGLPDQEKGGDLLLFFGRNSNFTMLENEAEVSPSYTTVITIGKVVGSLETKSNRCFSIGEERPGQSAKIITIHPPLLFGEWMPMNEYGILVGEKFIRFDSEKFKQEAVYIKDFARAVMQWIQAEELPANLTAAFGKTAGRNRRNGSFCVREGEPCQNKVGELLEHYRKYRDLYG
ncbi:hypothetical protein [Virgibacillus sediminis]|uniref:NAD(P)-binding domain-containing protein n=1 Tax=Virgibacillus sediminis TaxID=202260 RepID=A0ABV7AAN0_9BACI